MARRPTRKRPTTRKRSAPRTPKRRAKAKPRASAATVRRVKWLDDKSGAPVIEKYAQQLTSFMDALADGHVDAAEVRAQEERLVKVMKEVEPKLDNALHAKVTQLLCELTAYDLMQLLSSMHEAKPKAMFRG